jgi:hypothetical protein
LWRSDEVGIICKSKLELEQTIKRKEKELSTNKLYPILLGKYQCFETEDVKQNKIKDIINNGKSKNSWSLEQLDKKLNTSNEIIESTVFGNYEKSQDETTSEYNKHLSSIKSDHELSNVSQRNNLENSHSFFTSLLIPKRQLLRTKSILRCRKDIETSKLNILIRPFQFPLDGDSSLKTQKKGKWWDKDNSAIQEIPFISILKLPSIEVLKKGKFGWLELRVFNPKNQEILFSFSTALSSFDVDFDENNIDFQSNIFQLVTFDEQKQRKNNHDNDTNNSLTSSSCVNNVNNVTMQIGAYEDEVLRGNEDEDLDERNVVVDSKTNNNNNNDDNNNKNNKAGNNEKDETKKKEENKDDKLESSWKCETHHNFAIVKIPVKLLASDVEKLSVDSIFNNTNADNVHNNNNDNNSVYNNNNNNNNNNNVGNVFELRVVVSIEVVENEEKYLFPVRIKFN